MGVVFWILVFLSLTANSSPTSIDDHNHRGRRSNSDEKKREIIEVKDGPDDVVWIVQFSDLHFSVHYRERALDFMDLVGPALSIINPSLVIITGDLTDGKSKDLLTMKQNEEEWMEYQKVMNDVVKRSGLRKSIFYDLRGNHDNFGVPAIGGPFDYYSEYSFHGQLGRTGLVNSVTLQTGQQKLLFVGFDSAMSGGVRGPTNLFGHPTDELLNEINSQLSQWDSESAPAVTKISFGHFPLSFSASSYSGQNLKDIFLRNSLSAYLCGHLHSSFGKNLKRHHDSSYHPLLQKYFQIDARRMPSESSVSCSNGSLPDEFWEWEMGDWRKSRAMRILAIDRGFLSFVETDFQSGRKEIIILPTFPVDSRFLPTSSQHQYKCQSLDPSSFKTVRALVFSAFPISSVVVRIYDSRPGNFLLVVEETMRKGENASSRGDLYTVLWNYKAFEDPSPDRYWLQIEAIDIKGRSVLSELRPFSVNCISSMFSWTWKEFFVMGCQWDALYYPILWSFYFIMFCILIVPKAIFTLSKKQYTYRSFFANKGLLNGMGWVLAEHCRIPLLWICILGYLFYLTLFPWISGQVFTEGGERGYMTYKGWVVKSNQMGKLGYLGFPDIMVVVLPHILIVAFPAILVTMVLAAEGEMYRDHLLSLSGKKKEDYGVNDKIGGLSPHGKNNGHWIYLGKRWIRCILLVISLAICYKHYQNCRALVKAYELNPILHFPLYCLTIPLLLAYTIYKTRRV